MKFLAGNVLLIGGLTLTMMLVGCSTGDSGALEEWSSSEKVVVEPLAAANESPNHLSAAANQVARQTRHADRKIIYNAKIRLRVNDFSDFEQLIPKLIADHNGFVAERRTDRQHSDHGGGTWVIRIPVERYDAFLSGVSAAGFAQERNETAQDVTETYVDLEARIGNKQRLETRIVSLLEDRAGKLGEVIEIERELARVREEIERMQGQLNVLKDRTSLATVTLEVVEEARYVAPTSPTIGHRIAVAWSGSLVSIRSVAEGLVIVIVAITPWLIAFFGGFAITRMVWRRWRDGWTPVGQA